MCENKLLRGDIIKVRKHSIYWHYGVYIGEKSVIHFSSFPYRFWQKSAKVKIVELNNFSKNGDTPEVAYRPISTTEATEIARNAHQQLGKGKYIPLLNDCKRFAYGCKNKNNAFSSCKQAFGH